MNIKNLVLLTMLVLLCVLLSSIGDFTPSGKTLEQAGSRLIICTTIASTTIATTVSEGRVLPVSSFTLDKDLIKVLVKQGETKREIINITNTGNTILSINIESNLTKKLMIISEESFSLSVGESKIINIDIFAKEYELSDAYTGRIIIQANSVTKIINVIVEVKERKPLFDLKLQVLEKQLFRGDNVTANISMINMGDLKFIDVVLYNAIKNFEGDTLSHTKESIAIDTNLNVIRTLKIPVNTLDGTYLFYSKISYGNIIATATDTFDVVTEIERMPFLKEYYYEIMLLSLIGMIIIILLSAVFRGKLLIIAKKGNKRRKSKK